MDVISKRVYEVSSKGVTYWMLILFNISGSHYVGMPVRRSKTDSTIFLKSIGRHIDMNNIHECRRSMIRKCIYIEGSALEIDDSDLYYLFRKAKSSLLVYLKENVSEDVDGISYLKWCKDKLILNSNGLPVGFEIKQNAVYWVNFGYGVGSELRKLRPAIVWRISKDRRMCTVIPLTTKNLSDKYYFHYDLTTSTKSTAKIECMANISTQRITEPYFLDNKLSFISQEDKQKIAEAIERYYLFK